MAVITDFNKVKPIEVTPASGSPTISQALCFKITSGDDYTTGTGEIVLDWSYISSQADIGVYDENDNLLDYYFESFDATNKTAVIWCFRDWVRDGTVQAKIVYGNGPSDQSIDSSIVFDKKSNLRAGYLFNESSGDLLDVTSNNYDGSISSGITQNVDGVAGPAYHFNAGGEPVINIADKNDSKDSLLPDTSEFAVLFWMRPISKEGNSSAVSLFSVMDYYVGFNHNDEDSEYATQQSDSIYVWASVEDHWYTFVEYQIPSLDEWYYVVATWDNVNGHQLFINADLKDTNNSTESFVNLHSISRIATLDGTKLWFNGYLDTIEIYNTLLSVDEISAIYSATKTSPDFFSQQDVTFLSITTLSPANVTSSGATLSGELNDLSGNDSLDVYFEYGTDTSYGNTTVKQTISSVPTSFDADLSLLYHRTIYHYRAVATDGDGNYWYGDNVEFETPPVVTTDSPTEITSSSAVFNGKLDYLRDNSSLDVYFEYGTDTSYGNTTFAQTISNVPASFDIKNTGLTTTTVYHYRAVATDGNNYWYGDDAKFETSTNAKSAFDATKYVSVTSAPGSPTISRALCLKITSGDDSIEGTGDIVLDWANISSQADIGIYDENFSLLDYYFESFDAANKTAVIWVYKNWVRNGNTQAVISYGNGPKDQSVTKEIVFDKESNLQAGYLLNESSGDALDVTSNDYDGSVYGSPYGASGVVDGGYKFDGGSNGRYIYLYDFQSSSFTHSVWMNLDIIPDADQQIAIFQKESAGGDLDKVGLGINGDTLEWVTEVDFDFFQGVYSSGISNITDPILVVVVNDAINNKAHLYINGDLKDSRYVDLTQGAYFQNTSWRVARSYDNVLSKTFDGILDCLFFFSEAWSEDDITAYYDATKPDPEFFNQLNIPIYIGSIVSFTTGPTFVEGGITFFVTAKLATLPPTNVTSATSATLNGSISDLRGNNSLDVYFEYGTDTSYGNTTVKQTISSVPSNFSIDIFDISILEIYHYRAVATDGSNYWYGDDVFFCVGDISDLDDVQREFQEGILTDVEADSEGYLRLAKDEEGNYLTSGTRVSPQLDLHFLSTVGGIDDTIIEWNEILNSQTITVETRISWDNGDSWSSWKTATNGSTIPDLSSDVSVFNALLECRQTLSTNDNGVTPELHFLNVSLATPYRQDIFVDKIDHGTRIKIPSPVFIYIIDKSELSGTDTFGPIVSPYIIRASVDLSGTRTFDPRRDPYVLGMFVSKSGTLSHDFTNVAEFGPLSIGKSSVIGQNPDLAFSKHIFLEVKSLGHETFDIQTSPRIFPLLVEHSAVDVFYHSAQALLPEKVSTIKSGFESYNLSLQAFSSVVPTEYQAIELLRKSYLTWLKELCVVAKCSLGDQDLHNISNTFGHLFDVMYFNSFNTELQNSQIAINQLIRGDQNKDNEMLINGLITEIRNVLNSMNLLSGSTDEITKVINALQDPKSENVLSLLNSSEKGAMDFVRLLNHLSGTSIYPDVDYRIYIDGMSVKNKLTSASISISQNNVHNSITMSSFDENLYHNLDIYNDNLWGTARIEIQIGSSSTGTFLPSRILYFMMESVEGSEKSYDIWGRSMSASVDSPYAEQIQNFGLEEDTSISDVANDIITASGASVIVDWNTIDWVINKNWSFSQGVPLDGLQELANIGNFVVRSDDDGNLIVRDKNKVRPCNLSTITPDINYDRMWDLISLDYSIQRGNRITEVNVEGYDESIFLPMIEVEDLPEDDDAREIGQTSYVRVFWGGNKITDENDFGVVVTDGEYGLVQEDIVEEKQEVIHFTQSQENANVSYPIDGNSASITWYGNDGGNIYYNPGEQEITCDADYAVGLITYNTKFDRYKLFNHNVKELLFALWVNNSSAIAITVKLNVDTPDKPANDSISNNNITTESVAVHIGARWLDDNYYDEKNVTFTAPYNENVVDGVVAYINDANLGLDGNCIIRRADINFDGSKVTNSIEAVQWIS